MPTIDEIKNYLGIDYDDDVSNRNIKKYMSVADSWLKGAIGENYPKNDERAKQLALLSLRIYMIEDHIL